MVGQYLPKKRKLTFWYSALKRQIFLTSKQGLSDRSRGQDCVGNHHNDNLMSDTVILSGTRCHIVALSRLSLPKVSEVHIEGKNGNAYLYQ
jgi:hypothetical protein